MPARLAMAAAITIVPVAPIPRAPTASAVPDTSPRTSAASGATIQNPGVQLIHALDRHQPVASAAGARTTQVPTIHSAASASAATRRSAIQTTRRRTAGT